MFCRSIPRTITWWRAPGMSSLGPRGMCHPYQAFLRWARPQNVMPHARSSCCITSARPLISLRSTISLARHGSAMLSQFQQRTLRTYVPLAQGDRNVIRNRGSGVRLSKPAQVCSLAQHSSGTHPSLRNQGKSDTPPRLPRQFLAQNRPTLRDENRYP